MYKQTLSRILSVTILLSVFAFCLLPLRLHSGSSPGLALQEAHAAPAASAKELTIRPSVQTRDGRGIFQLTFSEPMIDPQKTPLRKASAPEDGPFTISPPINGEGYWTDKNTFVFASYDKLPLATRYVFTPKAHVVSLAGSRHKGKGLGFIPRHFYFRAEQTRYAADGTVTLRMNFSARVDPAKLKNALKITAASKPASPLPFDLQYDTSKTAVTEIFVLARPEQFGKVTLTLPIGFASEDGPVGVDHDDNARTVETSSMFAVRRVRGSSSSSPPWARHLRVETNNSVDIDNARRYISISPDMEYKLEASPEGFRITGDFATRSRLSVSMKKGMPGLTGVLTEDFTTTITFDDFSPRLAFDTTGTILSPNRAMRVPISSINVERVQATLWQLPEANIPFMAMGFFDGYKKHLSKKIAVRTGAINAVRNTGADSSIDLTQIAGNAKGVFLLTLADASDPRKVRPDEAGASDGHSDYDDEEGSGVIEKLVVISDIGITARIMPDSVTVWANSIATTEAIANARVRVFTANNALLAEGTTDKDGLWRHERAKDWETRERPALVLVSTSAPQENPKAEEGLSLPSHTDTAFVKLDSNLTADSAFDTGGRSYLRSGYEAYCFTPRGVFRPGETVDFKVLVRNAHMAAPEPFPVVWTVRSSTGRTVGSGTTKLSPEGGTSFSLPLVPSSPTGRYSMTVSLPGQPDKTLGYCAFSVEDFQPPRIEVKLASDAAYTVGKDNITVTVNADYLFGSPVADAPWESTVSISPRYFSHPSWRAFSFPSAQAKPIYTGQYAASGKLNDKGAASLTITPSDEWEAPLLNVTATVRVREDGGRWVARNVTIPRFKDPRILGYEFPKQDPTAGAPYSMRIASVTPDGNPSSLKSVSAVLESVQTYYVRTDRGYTHSTRHSLVSQADVSLENGIGTFTFTPPQRGEYRIRVTEASGSSLTANLSIWSGIAGSDDGASPLVDRIMLSWDKPRYVVGETANLTIRSPFPGKLLLVTESEKELQRRIIPLQDTETVVKLPVTEDMLPNAYCSAWVIRAVQEGKRWGAHRAFGVAPISIDRTASKLNVAVVAPETILPKKAMPVSISVTDALGKPVKGEVALAFVDEGLLSITNHATPDPFAYFSSKRAMQGLAYDLYEDLMPLSSRPALKLQAGGGAAGDASLLSPMTRKLELLSIFLGSVVTDENGKAETTLTLPEYSGRGRLMAVAASKTAVGNNASNVRVARDVTVEATVPRMAAPGDTFIVPLNIFGDTSKTVKASVKVTTQGPLAVEGTSSFSISVGSSSPRAAFPLAVKAINESGMGVVIITTTVAGSTEPAFEQRLEIPVRPPYPRLTRTGTGLVKGGESATIDVGGGFFPGTQQIALSFANTPGVGLFSALDYLRYYPYGCLEQTTSSAWPYLAVPLMLQSIDPEKANDSEFKQGLDYAVRRILAMQRPDGSFNAWPGSYASSPSYWGSVYATHFLTEAKPGGVVPPDALNAALGWLRGYLASPLPSTSDEGVMDSLSVKAYACYVLALNNDPPLGWIQFLRDQGQYLSQSARIFLAGSLALATGKTDTLRDMGTQPFVKTSRYGWSLESSPRNEALRLLMWSNTDPYTPEAAALARRVIDDGAKQRWRSTQENAMAVMALGRYMEKTAGKSQAYTATLSQEVKGVRHEIATFTDKKNPSFSREHMLPSSPAEPAPLKVDVAGSGTAYYTWTTSGIPMTATEPFAEGLFVGRRWVLDNGTIINFMDKDTHGNYLFKNKKITVPQGAKVTVTLFVKPEAAMTSLVLADIVPGGFEIDNPALIPDGDSGAQEISGIDPKTGKALPLPDGFKNARSLGRIGARTEMRDDRLLLFMDSMPAGPSAYTYTLRAVSKGTFVLPPVSAEDMYDPSIRALTPTGEVAVE